MFCDGTGKTQAKEQEANGEKETEEEKEKPAKEKTYRRKTPRQLAQEAIFDAMWAANMRPTETRLSPELKQERALQAEEARQERRRLREARQQQEREQKLKDREQGMSEEETSAAEYEKVNQRREDRMMARARADAVQLEMLMPSQEELEFRKQVQEKNSLCFQDVEDLELSLEDADPSTVEKVEKLTEFTRIGGSVEAATEVVVASVAASTELRQCLEELEHVRLEDPEGFADEVFFLLSECVASFFSLGIRPSSGGALPRLVRNRVKRVRLALRDLILGTNFVALAEGKDGRVSSLTSKGLALHTEEQRAAGNLQRTPRGRAPRGSSRAPSRGPRRKSRPR